MTSMPPTKAEKVVKPVGEYNPSRVVAQGTRIEHWLNGKKVLEVDTASDDWKERIAKSKFKSIKDFAAEKPGPILLQDHNNEVWFRNIMIRPLPSARSRMIARVLCGSVRTRRPGGEIASKRTVQIAGDAVGAPPRSQSPRDLANRSIRRRTRSPRGPW